MGNGHTEGRSVGRRSAATSVGGRAVTRDLRWRIEAMEGVAMERRGSGRRRQRRAGRPRLRLGFRLTRGHWSWQNGGVCYPTFRLVRVSAAAAGRRSDVRHLGRSEGRVVGGSKRRRGGHMFQITFQCACERTAKRRGIDLRIDRFRSLVSEMFGLGDGTSQSDSVSSCQGLVQVGPRAPQSFHIVYASLLWPANLNYFSIVEWVHTSYFSSLAGFWPSSSISRGARPFFSIAHASQVHFLF